jgi:3-deoxy-D-manno-octulosonic-acid transferase
MIYFLYSFLLALGFLIGLPYFLVVGLLRRKYIQTIPERLWLNAPVANPDGRPALWLQAVSVGEALVARSLSLRLRRVFPDLQFYLTTTTATGQYIAKSRREDFHGIFYFPFDWRFSVNRAFESLRPKLFLMAETELWPNVLRCCRERGIPAGLVNGRISEHSFRGYSFFRPFFKNVLGNIDFLCVQKEEDAERFRALGADPGRITVTGNIKYDTEPAPVDADELKKGLHIDAGQKILIAGSTMKGEEQLVLMAFRQMRTRQEDLLLVLAPRHPERFNEVEKVVLDSGMTCVRKTEMGRQAGRPREVLLLDTIGELARLYAIADIAFIGGSLLPQFGGHNVLEPAVYGKPVLFGPFMKNFKKESEELLSAGGGRRVDGSGDLARTAVEILEDRPAREKMASRARAFVEKNRGAAEKTIQVLKEYL